jgi:glucosamine--fructose-6-phosphate aminotransferase (isomerizing)
MEGLKRLEYRGYDSSGICTLFNGVATIRRREGKLSNLAALLDQEPLEGTTGIGHTRWATHGRPSETNAHPHQAGSVVLVHNGIIENYPVLKKSLREYGHNFKSDTDTEVIAHLIEHWMKQGDGFETAVRHTLKEVRGAYALCIVCSEEPDVLIAAKQGSPLVVGMGTGEFFVASDIPAILQQTRWMVFLEDGEMARLSKDGVVFSKLTGELLDKEPKYIEWTHLVAEKEGFRHFMLKEIFEQPLAVRDTLAGRLLEEEGDVYLEDLNLPLEELQGFSRICIVACGTSWHAGLVGKFWLEEYCRLPVEVDIASEFRYRNPVVDVDTLVLLISQSGETADTLAALREAHRQGGRCIAICNVIDSSIAREADGVIYTHAGPEIGVASTKAFVSQLIALSLLTIWMGRARASITKDQACGMIKELIHLPSMIEETLTLDGTVQQLARRFMHARDFLFLGRGDSYPIALEGALKLKELSYIHAEGYPAGEMKHGPIALIDEVMPVVVLALKDRHYEKVISNMEEVIARGGQVIALCSKGDKAGFSGAVAVLELPQQEPGITAPLLLTVPLQLLAYHISALLGNDVDQPRNLAKSVTVE